LIIITNFIENVNKKINCGRYCSVINIDEIGIYYDSQVDFTLDTKRVEIKTIGREKQRVSIILGVDLFDNINLNPFIILKGKTKRRINNITNYDNC